MGTTTDKLNYLEETKALLRKTLEEMGVTVTDEDTFRSYVEKFANAHPDTDYIPHAIFKSLGLVDAYKTENTVLGDVKFNYGTFVCPAIEYPEEAAGKEIFIPFTNRGNCSVPYNGNVTGGAFYYHKIKAPESVSLTLMINMAKPKLVILPTSVNLVKYTLYNGASGTDSNSFIDGGLGFGKCVNGCVSTWINRTLSTTKRVVKFPPGFRMKSGVTLYLSKIYITKECLQEMVQNLYDYIGTGEATEATRTISIGPTNKALLTSAEIETARTKGWVIS